MLHRIFLLFPLVTILFLGCRATSPGTVVAVKPGNAVNIKADSIVFAVIGDYGRDTPQEDSVAKMVKGWKPDFIITVGDNNYPSGSAATIKTNIGKYYGDYIYNPDATGDWQCHGKAAQEKQNRFFPAPGNHDNYSVPPLKPYLEYFTLPGDETNYDFTWGPVHFYSINSGTSGKLGKNSKVAQWVKQSAASDKSLFKIVYFHHPPYSSGEHGSSKKMRWPYREWGIDAVLTGHEHFYAKASDKASPNSPLYLICGSSGSDEHYDCNAHPLDKSKFDWLCDNVHFGAIKVTVTAHKAVFEYFAVEEPAKPLDVNILHK